MRGNERMPFLAQSQYGSAAFFQEVECPMMVVALYLPRLQLVTQAKVYN